MVDGTHLEPKPQYKLYALSNHIAKAALHKLWLSGGQTAPVRLYIRLSADDRCDAYPPVFMKQCYEYLCYLMLLKL